MVIPGTLTVNPRKIFVTLYECQSAYNGKYIEKDDIIYDVTCALAGVTVDIEQIYLLNVDDKFTGADQLDCRVYLNNNLLDSSNYAITAYVDKGAVVCRTKAEIAVKSIAFTANYEEGMIYSDSTLHVSNLLEGYTLSLRDGATTTSIEGDPYEKVEVENYFSIDDIVICDVNGEDVTKNFKINPEYGTIIINPKQS